jgi:hypothetical protein
MLKTDTLTDGWWLAESNGRRVARPFHQHSVFSNVRRITAEEQMMIEAKNIETVVGYAFCPEAVMEWISEGRLP